MGFTPEEIQDIKQRIKETIELLENTPPQELKHISRYERELSFKLARWAQQDLGDNSVSNGKAVFKGKSKNTKILKDNEGNGG